MSIYDDPFSADALASLGGGGGMDPYAASPEGAASPYSGLPQAAYAGLSQPQQPQMDPMMFFAAMGMDGQPPQQTPYQIAPQAQGGSWFKRLLSGALVGMAGGADSSDPATAFAHGAAAVEAQRQQDIQNAQIQQKLDQQDQMTQLARVQKFMDFMKMQNELRQAPLELQQKYDATAAQMVDAYTRQGDKAMIVSENDPQKLQAIVESLKADGKNPWSDVHTMAIGNKVLIYDNSGPKKEQLMAPGTTITLSDGKTQMTPYEGETRQEFTDRVDKYQQQLWGMEKMQAQEDEQTKRAIDVANIYSTQRGQTTGQITEKDKWQAGIDAAKYKVSQIQKSIDDLQEQNKALKQDPLYKQMLMQVQTQTITPQEANADPRYKPILDQINSIEGQLANKQTSLTQGQNVVAQMFAVHSKLDEVGQPTLVTFPAGFGPMSGMTIPMNTTAPADALGFLTVSTGPPLNQTFRYNPTTKQIQPLQ